MIDKPGCYKFSLDEYHRDPCIRPSLSRSVISDLIYKTPCHTHLNHPRLNPNYKEDDGNGKFDIGTAAHALLLEGVDNMAVIEADDWRTKVAKEARDLARKEGKTPLLKKQYAQVKVMVDEAIRQIYGCKELGIDNLSLDGDAELSYLWFEEDTWFKVRPDWISKDRKIILDYKTTDGSANPSDLARHIVSLGYDIQNALYVRGVKAVEGTEPKMIFVFQETEEPYLCSFVGLPPGFLEMAKSKIDYGIFLWRECMTTNKWPAYPNRVCWVEPPAWVLASWELKAQEIGGIE